MASQIAHIVYAKKYFDKIDNGKAGESVLDVEKIGQNHKINRDEFFLGVTFPDIRLIESDISRKETHLKFEPLNLDFSGLTSFEAGWKFHLYCDMRREEILNKNGFYKLEKTAELFGRPAKFLEDILLYEVYDNWEKMANYYRNPPLINFNTKVDRPTFVLWYAILARYIEEKITLKSISVILSKLPKLSKEAGEIVRLVDDLQKKDKVVKKLLSVHNEIV